jgi:hypothetical protein
MSCEIEGGLTPTSTVDVAREGQKGQRSGPPAALLDDVRKLVGDLAWYRVEPSP